MSHKISHAIMVKSHFIGLHRWPDAPDDVSFLREYHRHVFGVRIFIYVSHSDRQLEFFQVQEKLNTFLRLQYSGKSHECSCEMIAHDIVTHFLYNLNYVGTSWVSVSEDGENEGFAIVGEKKDPLSQQLADLDMIQARANAKALLERGGW